MEVRRIPEYEEFIKEHGVKFKNRPWGEDEEEVIRRYYGIIPTGELAKRLNDRTIKAVQDKAHAMGIKAEDNRKRWEEENS